MEYLDREGGKYLATKLKSYVDNKVTDLPSGTVDLTNYYTKEETDQLLANLPSGGTGTKGDKGDAGVGVSSIKLVNYELIITLTDGTVHNLGNIRGEKGEKGANGTNGTNGVSPTVSVTETTNGHTVAITDVNGTQSFEVLNGKDGISGGTGTGETEYEYDMNLDFSNKTFYFDTAKNLSEILTESDYYLHMRDASATGSMNGACFRYYKNGILYFTALVDGAISSICLYSSKEEQPWKYDTYTFPSTFKTPIYGKYAEDSTDDSIRPKELYKAIMSCVKKIVDSDGNEVSFKILNKPEEIISPTVSITETDNGHTVSITDVNGTQSFDVTNGTNGTDGVSSTVTVTKEGKIATITCTDVNGTTTATISDGADGQGGGSSGGGSAITYAYDTEIATGETWVDGKPIYLKVFHIDALASQSKTIDYKEYYNQTKFADTIISVNPTWKNGDNTSTGFMSDVISQVSTSSSSVGDNVNSYILAKMMWCTVYNGSEFHIIVGRGISKYTASCDVFVKYTKL